MNNRIKYVGYYDTLENGKQIRSYSLAAARKMDYICNSICETGRNVDIFSPSHIDISDGAFYRAKTKEIRKGVNLYLPSSIGSKNKLIRIFRVMYARLWLFVKLLRLSSDDIVIVYHNYNYALPVLISHFVKKYRLILEVEEIYSEIWHLSPFNKWKEKMLLRLVNNHTIFVSEVLRDKFSVDGLISYGSYEAYCGQIPKRTFKGEIKLIFSGLTDSERGSGFTAVRTLEYLPDNYTLVVSGPVASKDRESFFAEIKRINRLLGREACRYVGILDQEEFERELLSANIALNPQNKGRFEDYLFPSKILTYMSFGLPVVSTKGKSIVESQVANVIFFSDDFSPQSVAETVKKVNDDISQDEISMLNVLRENFLSGLEKELNEHCD